MGTVLIPKGRVQKKALDNIKEAKDFDSIRQNTPRQDNVRHKKQRCVKSRKYFGTGHPKKNCPAYSKMCGGCRKSNNFRAVYRSI